VLVLVLLRILFCIHVSRDLDSDWPERAVLPVDITLSMYDLVLGV